MLITSKFHDFYDTAMTYGVDKERVYRRETKEIDRKLDFIMPYPLRGVDNRRAAFEVLPIVVGFCGQVYSGIKVTYTTDAHLNPDEFVFGAGKVRQKLDHLGVEIDDRRWYSERYLDSEQGLTRFTATQFPELLVLFSELKVPVFVISCKNYWQSDYKLTVNPNLKEMQFQRVKDAPTAFQEIYQYLAGVLGNTEVDIVKISDKDMLKQKGFDQYSFKTMKGDKKPRAKNRSKK